MHAMHIRCHNQQADDPIQCQRQTYIAVIKHRGRVEYDLENNHGNQWRPDQDDRDELDEHGQQDFHGMETCARRDVKIQIGMMYTMQPPKDRYCMEHDVLQVNDAVEHDDGQQDCHPGGCLYQVEETPLLFNSSGGNTHGGRRKHQSQNHGVEHDQCEVVEPARGLGLCQCTARGSKLPQGHQCEDAKEGTQPDGGFMCADKVIHDVDSLSPLIVPFRRRVACFPWPVVSHRFRHRDAGRIRSGAGASDVPRVRPGTAPACDGSCV